MKLNYDSYIGTFIRRPNRFIAHIDIDGKEVICHSTKHRKAKGTFNPGVLVLLLITLLLPEDYMELRMIKKKEAGYL